MPELPPVVGARPGDEVDSAHAEAAHVLADEAGPVLRSESVTDDEILRLADAFCAREESGDVEGFVAWVEQRRHGGPPGPTVGR